MLRNHKFHTPHCQPVMGRHQCHLIIVAALLQLQHLFLNAYKRFSRELGYKLTRVFHFNINLQLNLFTKKTVFSHGCTIYQTHPHQGSGRVLKDCISLVIRSIWLLCVSFGFVEYFELCFLFYLQFLNGS